MTTSTTDWRLGAVREQLQREGLDALLVSGPENRRYLSAFTAEDPDWGLLLITVPEALLLTDFRYQIWAQQEAQGFEVVTYPVSLADTLAELLQRTGVKRLGFEAAYLSYRQYQRLTKAAADAGLQVEWRPVESVVEGLREVKTPEELARMRRALELTETVLQQVAAGAVPGDDGAGRGLGNRKAPAGRRRRRSGLSAHRGRGAQQRPPPPPPRGLSPEAGGTHHHRYGGPGGRLLAIRNCSLEKAT